MTDYFGSYQETGTKIVARSGAVIHREPPIDFSLSESDTTSLYEKWDKSWEAPLMFQGGQTSITCEMVAALSNDALVSVYGKEMTKRIRAVATKFAIK